LALSSSCPHLTVLLFYTRIHLLGRLLEETFQHFLEYLVSEIHLDSCQHMVHLSNLDPNSTSNVTILLFRELPVAVVLRNWEHNGVAKNLLAQSNGFLHIVGLPHRYNSRGKMFCCEVRL
jgi:hypothetical protein